MKAVKAAVKDLGHKAPAGGIDGIMTWLSVEPQSITKIGYAMLGAYQYRHAQKIGQLSLEMCQRGLG